MPVTEASAAGYASIKRTSPAELPGDSIPVAAYRLAPPGGSLKRTDPAYFFPVIAFTGYYIAIAVQSQ